MTTSAIGEEGFRWFIGKVEDREDPKKLGRVRVRIYNVHPFLTNGDPDTVNVPKDHLPWAMPINSIVSAGITSTKLDKDGIGMSPTGLIVGSTVVGFFADGNECQIPLVMGTIAGVVGSEEDNETPKNSREVDAVGKLKNDKRIKAASPFPGEPASVYKAKYPYNKVFRSESGHIIEVDDSPANERLHIMHKTGSYVEIDKDGNVVVKSVKNKFDVTTSNNNVFVGGACNVYVKGNATIKVDGSFRMDVGGTTTIASKGNMKLTAPRIDLN